MHDQLFETQSRDREELLSLAGSLGIDSDDFIECLENRSVADRITADVMEAERLGLNGTPGFAIGIMDSSRRLQIYKLIEGARPFSIFDSVLTEAINEVGAGGS